MPWPYIPPEIFEEILTYLDVKSIKSLRLVNRSLSENCMGPYFRSFIGRPTTDLTAHSLAALDSLVSNAQLKQSIHTLTIFATCFDSSNAETILATGVNPWSDDYVKCSNEELNDIRSELGWLNAQKQARQAESLGSIVDCLALIFRRLGTINTIKLDAVIICGPNSKDSTAKRSLRSIWTRAAQVHSLTMSAIARSGISVARLNIYRDTPRCSVSSKEHAVQVASLSPGDLSAVYAGLDTLELSISTELVSGETQPDTERPEGVDKAMGLAETNLPGIARLLKWTPNLQKLNLHFYHVTRVDPAIYDGIFTAMADTAHLPRLQDCFLGGLYLTEESLLQFLKKHPTIQHLALDGVSLMSGLWDPIFTHLSTGMLCLTHLHLSNLWRNGLLQLYPVWQKDIPEDRSTRIACPGRQFMVHTRSFTAEELQKGLEFRSRPTGCNKGTSEIKGWRRRREAEYGPEII